MDTPTQKPTRPNPAALDAIADRISWFLAERELARRKELKKTRRPSKARASKQVIKSQ